MAKFTGGVASYLRRINTGNYEHKEFKAEISWVAEPEDDQLTAEEWLERAADTAIAVVHQRLGLTERPVENHTLPVEIYTPPVEEPASLAPKVEDPAPPVEEPVKRGPGRPKKNPDAVATIAPTDPLLAPVPPTVVISDRDLGDKLVLKIQELHGDPLPIRNLITSFGAPTYAAIPEDRRAEFLVKLAELKG